MSENSDMKAWALRYVSFGWHISPVHSFQHGCCSCGDPECKHPGKHPRVKGAYKAATTDVNQVEQWWTDWPDANIGIATGAGSGIFVLDVDPKNGGNKSLAKLQDRIVFGFEVVVATGGGGAHHYYRFPKDQVVRCSAGKIGDGLDIRGEGGYIIAPPSSHASGRRYEWAETSGPHEQELPEAPPALLELIASVSKSRKKKGGAGQAVPKFSGKDPEIEYAEGERNAGLASVAGSLRRSGLDQDEIEAALLVANKKRCKPPLGEDEVREIAESIARYPAGQTLLPAHDAHRLTPAGKQVEGLKAGDLLKMDLPEGKWIVPGLIPEGSVVLAAKPKGGKSFLALQQSMAVASGGTALNGQPVEQGRVLYLALEDNKRRLQGRLKVLGGETMDLDLLELHTDWPRDGWWQIDQWLDDNADARLVVIDTLGRFKSKPDTGKANAYETDYEDLKPLAMLAEHHGVAILLIHHLRKSEAADPIDLVSGSTGLTAVADAVLVLQRPRNSQKATLTMMGRDIAEDDLHLRFEGGVWSLDAPTTSPEQDRIVDAIRKSGKPMSPAEIASATGLETDSAKHLLKKLLDRAVVVKPSHGVYTLPST